jgi:hypothetical protein
MPQSRGIRMQLLPGYIMYGRAASSLPGECPFSFELSDDALVDALEFE